MLGGRWFGLLAVITVSALFAAPGASSAFDRPRGQALQMQIDGGLNLNGFGSIGLAYQRYVSSNVAWRVGVSADAGRSTEDESYLHDDGVDVDQSYEDTLWDHEFSVTCEWLRYKGEKVAFYYGGGPWFEYSSSRRLYRNAWQDQSDEWVETERAFGAGLRGCLGVQWAAWEWLAIHAEYSSLVFHRRVLSDRERTVAAGETEYFRESFDRSSFSLKSNGVRFGLSLYF